MIHVRSLLLLTLFLAPAAVRAQPAHLVRDINTYPWTSPDDLSSHEFTTVGNQLYFVLDDNINGLEIWTSDGTPEGTRLLRDLCPGACSSNPHSLISFQGLLFFAANDGASGEELWKSDGTATGTQLVKDILPGLGNHIGSLIAADDTLFFTADEGVHGQELWKSDGTAAGTQLVKDLLPGSESSLPRLRAAGEGHLLLSAWVGPLGGEPWISDGTEEGTFLLGDLSELSSSDPFFPSIRGKDSIALPGGGFLFLANTVSGQELWRTDGTPEGTALLKDVAPGEAGSSPYGLTLVNGKVFFAASTPANGTELWATDGTSAGTMLVEDIFPGATGSGPFELTAAGDRLFFRANDGIHGQELWVSNGTPAGTFLVKDFRAGGDYGFPDVNESLRFGLSARGNELLFFARDDESLFTDLKIGHSDGTEAGTALVPDPPGLREPTFISLEDAFQLVDGRLFFLVYGFPTVGRELWVTDGTTAGTVLLRRITSPASAFRVDIQGPFFDQPFAEHDGHLLFRATDGTLGEELWRSDGTESGTALVRDLVPGETSSYPFGMIPFEDSVLFAAYGNLWRTDGTEDGTQIFSPVGPGFVDSAVLGNSILFSARSDETGWELWETDGTAAGTAVLKDIVPGSESSQPERFAVSGGNLFFAARNETGIELWKSDGTEAGTQQVADLLPSDYFIGIGSNPFFLTDNGGTLFFAAEGPGIGMELWKSDGTEAGTVLVKDIWPGLHHSMSFEQKPVALPGGLLVFPANDGTSGRELWRSDGTEAGTVLVKDISPGTDGSSPLGLTVAGGRVYFSADDGAHGRELWVTDGTEAGTRLVEDLFPGEGSSLPAAFFAEGPVVTFAAYDPFHGVELWRSDGTALGTRILQNIAPGAQSSSPVALRSAGSSLFFVANDNVTGFELWSLPKTALLSTFADVPADHWAWRQIEALVAAEITQGCGNDSYCPGNLLTRAEMAVFLGRALHGSGFVPPPATGTRFGDVPASHWAGAWIEQIATDGITLGCSASPPRFCPGSLVTRAEMAIFLLRAKHGGSYTPPPATGTRFTDVPATHWAAAWIEQLAAEGITQGCAAGLYCPGGLVNRAEMAVFLTRTFGLAMP